MNEKYRGSKTVWIKVRFIQESLIPVDGPADWPDSVIQSGGIQRRKNRPPDERLGTNPKMFWEYSKVDGDGGAQ